MAIVERPGLDRVLLHGISWTTYEALLAELDNRHMKLTYDRGSLEIMSPSHSHENLSRLIGRLVAAFTEELQIAIKSGGSTTFRREAKKRGLEPDECYWIRNEARMRGKKEFDFGRDPPPDLAIEVDITSHCIDRLPIYAALGIAEIWRFDGGVVHIYRLRSTGKYQSSVQSRALPAFPVALLAPYLKRSHRQDETSLVREFRQWIRNHVIGSTRAGRPMSRKNNRRQA